MPLIAVHIHIHNASPEAADRLKAIAENIKSILKTTTMAQETLDQLTTKVNAVTTSLTNIKEDITRIKDSLPAEGGLTADEVAALSAQLDAAVGAADALDKENEPA